MTAPEQHVSRRAVLRGASALALGSLACAPALPRKRPNLLLVVADDLGKRDLGCYGNASISTPNIDRIAREGCLLERAYTTVAICRPSRVSLSTGLHPQRSGVTGHETLDDSIDSWPAYLRRAEYSVAVIGKSVTERSSDKFDFARALGEGQEGRRKEKFYSSALVEFVEESGDRPFAAMVNLLDPHVPGGRRYNELFARQRKIAGTSAEKPVDIPAALADTVAVRNALGVYYDGIRRLDDAVGLLLDQVDALGVADDTLVIFTSDNGADLPFAKTTVYEAGINMPFLARWTGSITPGMKSDALVSFVDVLPTLLDAAQVPATEAAGLDGRSFLPLLRGERDTHADAVFASRTEHRAGPSAPARAVVRGDYKYIRNFHLDVPFECAAMGSPPWRSMATLAAGDPALQRRMLHLRDRSLEELYDLKEDPDELTNRAADPSLESARSDLSRKLRSWMESIEDPLLSEWVETR